MAQCLEIDIASQGETEAEALPNLGKALSLHFELQCGVWYKLLVPSAVFDDKLG